MSKRSPPATPPAVLTNTADSPCASGDGNRTRNEPDSCRRRRRVTPSARCTSNLTEPTARLAAKISEAAWVVSVCICPRAVRVLIASQMSNVQSARTTRPVLQGHGAAELARIELAAIAGEFDGAAIHHGKMVAEFAGKVE